MNDQHDDDASDPRRERAMAVAKRALAGVPVCESHRHGVIVGIAADMAEAEVIAIIAVVQGVAAPCWIALDDDDLDRIGLWIERRALADRTDVSSQDRPN